MVNLKSLVNIWPLVEEDAQVISSEHICTRTRQKLYMEIGADRRSSKMRTSLFWEPFVQDIRYAFRGMAGSKLFTSMAVLSLALGIGANTAIYSFMDSVMLRALPVKHPEQLVILNWRAKSDAPVVHSHWGSYYDEPGGSTTSPNFPYPAFEVLRDHNEVLSTLFGHAGGGEELNLVIDGNAELASGQYVTGGFFSGLGVAPAAGRLIDGDDDRSGAPAVAVITNDYWHARFGASTSVVGKHIQINGASFTIVGVSALAFYGVSPAGKPSAFLPMANIGLTRPRADGESMFDQGTYYWIELMGRLKNGVTLQQAQVQLAGMFHGFVETYGDEGSGTRRPSRALAAGGRVGRRFPPAPVCEALVDSDGHGRADPGGRLF